MSIGLLITDRNLNSLTKALQEKLPNISISAWPNIESLGSADFIVTWRQPENIWTQLPNAKVVCSLGAGVDGLVKDPYLPKHLPIVRIVDASLSKQMADYVLATILLKKQRLDQYLVQQSVSNWQMLSRSRYNNVAVLGVGQIGQVVGQRLVDNGFNVTGWSRQNIPDVTFDVKTGQDGLAIVLNDADYVVSLLPSTKATYNIFNANMFKLMQPHSCLINVGRGDAVNEHELILALDSGEIGSAVLDVVKTEPLPEDSPLWLHEKILITPHIAAITEPEQVVEQIVSNYLAYQQKQPLKNMIDRTLGY